MRGLVEVKDERSYRDFNDLSIARLEIEAVEVSRPGICFIIDPRSRTLPIVLDWTPR